MREVIYLVKKDVTKPYSEDNWIMMNGYQFNNFIKSPAAKGRYFADLGAHEDSTTWYIAECDRERAIKWRAELNRHYYLKRMERESGMKTVYMSSLVTGDDEVYAEEIIADPNADFVAEMMQKTDIDNLNLALVSLDDEEYDIIYWLYLTEKPLTEREYSALRAIPQQTLNNRKIRILKKIKKFL